jgi:sterol desaturase/sphingolipid hydroxylase (fatty acid hydroxylase superfamily)
MLGLYLFVALIAWFALLVWAERRWPVVPGMPARAYWLNLYSALVMFVVGFPTAWLSGGLAARIPEWTGVHLSLLRLDSIGVGLPQIDGPLRVAAMIVLPLLVYELWFAASHRLQHFVPACWDFHKVHHADRWLNPLSIFRDSFVHIVWRSFFPLLTVGLFIDLSFREGGEAALLSQVVLFAWSGFCHSNIRIELPWLEGILVTPQYHRLHHSDVPGDEDCNFADVFPVFDMVFGRYRRPRPGEFPRSGLTSGERIEALGPIVTAPLTAWAGRLRGHPAGREEAPRGG